MIIRSISGVRGLIDSHLSSEKIKMDLGFESSFSINDAIAELREAFEMGKLMNSLTDEKYFNIKRMQNLELS